MSNTRVLFLLLAALLTAARLCHVGILWAEEALPLAAAQQMHGGKTLYRDIWFDKPPLAPALYWMLGRQPGATPAKPAANLAAGPGWLLRLAGALYALLACWIASRFARDLWTEREALWAAGLMGFFLIFDFPAAAIPLAADLLMLAPHLAAVWLAYRRQSFWSGAAAGVAFLISPKALFVLAVCALWNPAGMVLLAAGFAAVSAAAATWLWSAGALGPYWDEVWRWGRLYAAAPFAESPIRNGIVRTLNWLGFHITLVVAACAGRWLLARGFRPPAADSRPAAPGTWPAAFGPRPPTPGPWPAAFGPRPPAPGPWPQASPYDWLVWLLISFAGVAAGLRFFPRYYFQLLPVFVLLAARGFTSLGRGRALAALLLLIPAARFGPAYFTAFNNPNWRDTAIDRDSRAAAALTRQLATPGDTLFVWGYRPELYVYTQLPAATMFLDSQPLTGVPADRHLTQSTPVETGGARLRRAELVRSRPTFVLDGLGMYNPRLAITRYADLREWLANYREVARPGQTVIYQRVRALGP